MDDLARFLTHRIDHQAVGRWILAQFGPRHPVTTVFMIHAVINNNWNVSATGATYTTIVHNAPPFLPDTLPLSSRQQPRRCLRPGDAETLPALGSPRPWTRESSVNSCYMDHARSSPCRAAYSSGPFKVAHSFMRAKTPSCLLL